MTMFGSQWFAAPSVAAYEIDNSCIFNDNDSPYLSKTLGTATDANRWTYSTWLKRGNIGTSYPVIVSAGSGGGDTDRGDIVMTTDNEFQFSGGTTIWRKTTQKFRDITAWYHLVVAVNTDESGNDMIKIYINGSQITAFATTNNPSGAANTGMNTAIAHNIGRQTHGSDGWWDGYMSEINFIDGQQLTPASFGETNDEGVWIPTEFSGTYGDNGFFLEFGDSSALGDDTSGETNDWATSGLTASDQSTDTPTNNHCTVNAIESLADTWTITQGNKFPAQAANNSRGKCNFGIDSADTDGWYWECELDAIPSAFTSSIGILPVDNHNTGNMADPTSNVDDEFYGVTNQTSPARTYKHIGGTSSSLDTVAMTAGQIFGVAVKGNKIWIAKNNVWWGSGDPSAGSNELGSITAGLYYPVHGARGGTSGTNFKYSFAEAEWTYSAPTGFKAICTANIPEPAVKDPSTNFQAQLYAGNGTAIGSGGKAVTFDGNSAMQPDIVWTKNRSATDSHANYDAARGVTKEFNMDDTNDEATVAEGVTTFGSDGFTVGSNVGVNTNTENYVAWNWAAGNSGSSNEDGSINTTTTYVDQTAGISISTYTGTGDDDATIGHGLGVTPTIVWVMPRSNGDHHLSSNWQDGISVFTEKWKLNDTEAASSSSAQIKGASSTTFTLGSDVGVNGDTRTYVAYAFVEVEGFSKFGTFTGNNNADGPFIYTGFKPRWYVQKADIAGYSWCVIDRARTTYNGATSTGLLFFDSTSAEYFESNHEWDFLSNGIKVRGTGNNSAGQTTVYMAFAENPFGGDGVAPATAI